MKEELELRHLAPYLPYGLKLKGNTHGEIVEMACVTETGINIKDRGFAYGMWADLFDIKPILRPLSDLNKQHIADITEYSDIDDIRIERNPNSLCFINTEEKTDLSDYMNPLEFLFKNHFDVFGLIPEGLAIDINTLKEANDE